MLKVTIVGATGYVGLELLRLLNNHPKISDIRLISKSSAGNKLIDLYPQFRNSKYNDKKLENYSDSIIKSSDLVFTALPHGVSQDMVANINKLGVKIIDMSGDYRYQDTNIYRQWYNNEHKYSDLASKAVYGLTEYKKEEIKKAEIIANPGCYPTASLLATLPLLENDLIDQNSIIIDAKSGVSGAGRSLNHSLLFNEVNETLKAYNIATHRHTSEIEYILSELSNYKNLKLIFTPHLIPIKRGILATIYADLKSDIQESEVLKIYKNTYRESDFVQVLESSFPEIKYVLGSNNCQIGIKVDARTRRVIVISTIDNMVKGSAGQAIQNMNLIFGYPETTGLEATAVLP
ncbi:N-acetyl-gamma-glutamyl-phosphate reductase [Natronospora cellulosivora (SeqCode)]